MLQIRTPRALKSLTQFLRVWSHRPMALLRTSSQARWREKTAYATASVTLNRMEGKLSLISHVLNRWENWLQTYTMSLKEIAKQLTSIKFWEATFVMGLYLINHVFTIRLRKNSSITVGKDLGDKKGRRLIEKEAMETGKVCPNNLWHVLNLFCMSCGLS